MHLKFPEKVDNGLRFLKLKLLPKTLFFRTMLLIFIPLIVVQVVSIVAFFDGSWGRVGKRLSTNLTSDMAFMMQLVEKSPDKLSEIQKLSRSIFDIDLKYYGNDEKHKVLNKTSRNSKLVTGFWKMRCAVNFLRPSAAFTWARAITTWWFSLILKTACFSFRRRPKTFFRLQYSVSLPG